MAALDSMDIALLESVRRSHRWLLLAGVALIACGGGYAVWGALRFDARAAIETHASFDRPVSSLTRLYDPYKPVLRQLRPTTENEHLLLWGLRANMSFTAGVLITLLRLFFGLLTLICGLFLIAAAYERQRLVRIVHRLLL
jgi:hypothetical protein